MRFALITAAAALTASAFAAPEAEAVPKPLCRAGVSRPGCVAKARGPPSNKPVAGQTCMSDEDAAIVADTFKSLIRGYTKEQATAALTEDFVDYSSAVSIGTYTKGIVVIFGLADLVTSHQQRRCGPQRHHAANLYQPCPIHGGPW